MKRGFIFLLFLWMSCWAQAQNISVVNFQKLENDLDARVNDPVLDPNGKKCALIKVVTVEKDFTFDVGQLGVVKTLYKPAEVWVYVPKGVNKIKITHPKLGQIKSDDGYYWFETGGVEEATCYRMEITTAKLITTIEEPEIRSGYLILKSEPEDAGVYITVDEEERYYGQTPMEGVSFPYGTYRYRLSKNMYHSASGEISVNNSQVSAVIRLQPAFGYLDISTQPSGAQIVIEGQDKEYTSPCKPQLSSGTYKIRLVKKLYGTYEQKVTVSDNQTTPLKVTLEPKFARLVVNSLPGDSVYIDGKFMGKGPKYEVDLLEGLHNIEVRLASHKTVKKQIEMIAKKDQVISLEPIPIFGALDIKPGSTSDATIFIDNKNYGKAPQVIYDVLVGKHTVKLEKTGYESIVKEVVIEEGKTLPFEEKMETHIPLTVKPSSTVEFPANGGMKILNVSPKDGWILEKNKTSRSWLTLESGEGYVHVKAPKNKTHSSRFESFFIRTPTERKQIFISQQGSIIAEKTKSRPNRQCDFEDLFYGELSFQVDLYKHIALGVAVSLGGYLPNRVNIEALGAFDVINLGMHLGLKTGYGLRIGSKISLTPQAGLGWRTFFGGENAFTVDAALRLSVGEESLIRFLAIPEYGFIFASKSYPRMSALKAWRNVLGLRIGFTLTIDRQN